MTTRPGAVGPADRLLPAEIPGFWLRLLVFGAVLTIGFMAWYLYVTRPVAIAPAPQTEIATAVVVPQTPAPTATPAPLSAMTLAPSTAPAATAPPRTVATVPAAPRADAPQQKADRPAAQPRAPSVETGSRTRTSRPYDARPDGEEPEREASIDRTLALARELNEADPPGTSDSTPQYRSGRTPSRLQDDPGPPIAPGPGPLYDSSRAAARTPTLPLRADPGPPIVVGPGPLVDYSSPALRSSSGR